MDQPAAKAESVFSRAIELSPGSARDEYVAKACGDDAGLRQEVVSLLRAHDAADGFLSSQDSVRSSDLQEILPASTETSALHPAAHAAAFLLRTTQTHELQVRDYVAALPEGIRQETGERIWAGLRVRQMRFTSKPPQDQGPESWPRLPGFRIERKLGEGGVGTVYAAIDEKLNRRVALKILRQSADTSVRRRILDEARKAAALGDPAAVTIFSVLDEADPPAIVMEWIEGFPVDRFAERLNFEQKARLLGEIARALAVAHAGGLVHRDLKPDNILVGPDLRPRLLDFGLALSIEEARQQGQGFAGTPLYASPEQVAGQSVAPASDVFSFGSLMFKVLTGRAPFAGDNIRQVFEAIATTAPPFLRDVAVGVPEDLQAICLACLSWNPSDRPAAADIALELGRFLVGEPIRLKPKLYDDLLRRSISNYASQAQSWQSQNIISSDERDSLAVIHRRLLADEDHWIIDARRITPLQTLLSGATWLTVVGTVLTVWMLRDELAAPWRWWVPAFFTLTLLLGGHAARRQKETLSAATFLAGAALAIAPTTLALLAEWHVFHHTPENIAQLFPGRFTNTQVLASSLTAFSVSIFGFWRLQMTGFAWTTATLATTSYLGFLLLFNWLEQKPEIQALWCLPMISMEAMALFLERRGRVRWTLPFHLVALVTLVACLDVIALNGPTLNMLGVQADRWPFFDDERQTNLSLVLNGLLFLGLMLLTERSSSLDLRRAGKLFEVLAILHTLGPLYANAINHRENALVRIDVWAYVIAALLFAILAPFRSRWRLLVGGLAGCGLGCYLLVDLGLVARQPFIIGLGFIGLLTAMGTFVYVRRKSQFNHRLP